MGWASGELRGRIGVAAYAGDHVVDVVHERAHAAVGAQLLLFTPGVMHGANGVTLGTDPSLLSEVRAPGGALVAFGALIAAGAWVRRLRFPAAVAATALYGSYAAARATTTRCGSRGCR